MTTLADLDAQLTADGASPERLCAAIRSNLQAGGVAEAFAARFAQPLATTRLGVTVTMFEEGLLMCCATIQPEVEEEDDEAREEGNDGKTREEVNFSLSPCSESSFSVFFNDNSKEDFSIISQDDDNADGNNESFLVHFIATIAAAVISREAVTKKGRGHNGKNSRGSSVDYGDYGSGGGGDGFDSRQNSSDVWYAGTSDMWYEGASMEAQQYWGGVSIPETLHSEVAFLDAYIQKDPCRQRYHTISSNSYPTNPLRELRAAGGKPLSAGGGGAMKLPPLAVEAVGAGYWVSIELDLSSLPIPTLTAKAWGVRLDEPVHVRIMLPRLRTDVSTTADPNAPLGPTELGARLLSPPTIQLLQFPDPAEIKDAFMCKQRAKFPLGQQLSRAVNAYLKRRWLNPQGVNASHTEPIFQPPSRPTAAPVNVNPNPKKNGLNEKADVFSKEFVFDASPELFTEYHHHSLSTATLDGGLLRHIVDYLINRIPTACRYCVLCDQTHVFDCNVLRPAVCARSLCTFAFTELKIGADAAEAVAMDAAVTDLLINIFSAAALSGRNIVDPFPSVADPARPGQLLLDPQKPDANKLRTIAKCLPTTKELFEHVSPQAMSALLQSKGELAQPLLSWILSSNRSYISKMEDRAQIKCLGTPHQFLLVMSTPEREAKFKALKAQHGTRWGFHGSPRENWHSILRQGLKNFSGTTNQLHGAAHGGGVYFGLQLSTSLGYSKGNVDSGPVSNSYNSGEQYLDSTSMVMMCLCEIITNAVKEHGWCWTVDREECIMPRFFFAYAKGSAPQAASNLTNTDPKLLEGIRTAMDYYNL